MKTIATRKVLAISFFGLVQPSFSWVYQLVLCLVAGSQYRWVADISGMSLVGCGYFKPVKVVVVGRRSRKLALTPSLPLAVLLILGLVNFLSRYPVRVDFTETQLFTQAPQSRQLVRNLQRVLRCGCLTATRTPRPAIAGKLRQAGISI